MTLPTFVVIGAMKAGTVSLRHYLDLRDRLAECLAADLRRFEHLLGHQVPSHWKWSTGAAELSGTRNPRS